MKGLFIFSAVLISFAACKTGDKKADPATPVANTANTNSANMADTSNFTTIEWVDKINQTLPKIKEGAIVEITYRFKNTGSKPLVVADVSASCGCTVPEKPQKPILPGEEGLIKAKFVSKGKPGSNTKTLTVAANTMSNKVLTFSVDVEKE